MGRKLIKNPTLKRTIQVEDDLFQYIHRCRDGQEPIYITMRKFFQSDKAAFFEESAQKGKTISALYDRIHEQERQINSYKNKQNKLFEVIQE